MACGNFTLSECISKLEHLLGTSFENFEHRNTLISWGEYQILRLILWRLSAQWWKN